MKYWLEEIESSTEATLIHLKQNDGRGSKSIVSFTSSEGEREIRKHYDLPFGKDLHNRSIRRTFQSETGVIWSRIVPETAD